MDWTHLKRLESCERSNRRAYGREDRKKKATYYDTRRHHITEKYEKIKRKAMGRETGCLEP